MSRVLVPGPWPVDGCDIVARNKVPVLRIASAENAHATFLEDSSFEDLATFNAGILADDVSADVVSSPVLQQVTSGPSTHSINAQQATNGQAIHQQVFNNLGVLSGVVYTIKGSSGSYQRVDLVIQGTYTLGVLYIGGPSSDGIGVGKLPSDKLDVSGRVRSTGWIPTQKAAAEALEGEVFRDTDGKLKEIRGGVVRTFNTTP